MYPVCNISLALRPQHGNISVNGITATYTCDTGYLLVGSPSRTCGADGNWTSTKPHCSRSRYWSTLHVSKYSLCVTCAVIDCGLPADPDNGQVDTSNRTTIGSVATFSCNIGYTMSHQQMALCGVDGIWSPASPSCNRMHTYLLRVRCNIS